MLLKKLVKCKCTHCEKSFEKYNTKIKLNNFCSIVCSNSHRKHSLKTREKISKTLSSKEYKTKYCHCSVCNTVFEYKRKKRLTCSTECAEKLKQLGRIKGGLKSATSQQKRSKNEIAFAELLSKQFTNIKYNEPMFNGWDADIILPNLKIAILWNGPWHYKKITRKHSLEQVQNRDKIKHQEILNAGYFPYIIKDDGKYNLSFVEKQFQIFLKWEQVRDLNT